REELRVRRECEDARARAEVAVRRLEGAQAAERRRLLARLGQHVAGLQNLPERLERRSAAAACDGEPFLQMVVRCELAGAGCGASEAAPSPVGSGPLDSGSAARDPAAPRGGASGSSTTACSVPDAPARCTSEALALAGFLGARFLSLRGAMAAMDPTGSGAVTCTGLQAWLPRPGQRVRGPGTRCWPSATSTGRPAAASTWRTCAPSRRPSAPPASDTAAPRAPPAPAWPRCCTAPPRAA
ncbi:unnamed protein product, partial [Prorocentrum cordatum]